MTRRSYGIFARRRGTPEVSALQHPGERRAGAHGSDADSVERTGSTRRADGVWAVSPKIMTSSPTHR
jgi:hypothetical protein